MEPHVRLLVCNECHTVDEIPDYVGDPEGDELLQHAVGQHQHGDNLTSIGGRNEGEVLTGDRVLARVERKHWSNADTRQQILAQLGAGRTGFEQSFYDTRNTFEEDAGRCFNRHGRPTGGCIDWKDKSKRVGNGILTEEEKSLLDKTGKPLRMNRAVFLCDFCPVSTYVQTEKFKKSGAYDR